MAQIINIGNQSNDGTGDSIRDAFNKVNQNFTELYGIAGVGGGLYFTKLKDTPKLLTASTASGPAILVSDNFGNTLTNKKLIAGQGIIIDNTNPGSVIVGSQFASLSADINPQLGGNLDGQNLYRAINFADPIYPQDLATKQYADNNSPFSAVNFYVSTNGRDTFGAEVPKSKWGRELGYAFRTINRACQEADEIISTSTQELSSYAQNFTLNSGLTTATVHDVSLSTAIAGNYRVRIDINPYDGTDQFLAENVKPGMYLFGEYSGSFAFIEELGEETIGSHVYEFYDVTLKTGNGFVINEPLQFSYEIPTQHITIFVESGIYLEQLPIKVPANVSLRGDEFRRCIVKPAPGTSTSKWAKTFFRRDDNFDGLTRNSRNGRTALAPAGQLYGYHYLTNPSDINSQPKLNGDMDVFLMNDAGIIRALSVHGHGGFMCVLDPEGQIRTKSPYIQNCSSLARSYDLQTFSGGLYVDGFAGNLECNPVDAVTYYLGTTTISVSGLSYRDPQTPTSFYQGGNRYEVDYFTSAFVYNVATCSRDTGLIVDGLVTDLLFSDNGYTQSNFAGLQYWAQTGYTPEVTGEATTITNTLNYVNTLVQRVIVGDTGGTRYQSTVPQVTGLTTATNVEVVKVNTEFTLINNIINNGTGGVTDQIVSPASTPVNTAAQNASALMQANKEYIKAEAIAFVTYTYPGFSYSQANWERDISNIIDDVSFDTTYGGNRQAIQSGVYYYGYSSLTSVIQGERVQTITAYERLAEILPSIATGAPITASPGNSASQVTAGTPGTAAEGTELQNMVNLITGIIQNGPVAANTATAISLTISSNADVINAAALVYANRSFIISEIIAFINYTFGSGASPGTGVLHLNPRNAGGIAFTDGIIPVNDGVGYSFAPTVLFDQPTQNGGFPAQGTANLNAGVIESITVTNPGSGYTGTVYVNFIGGNPITPADPVEITGDNIRIGYIGVLPATVELGTAGNKSILSADYTQVNDLGYGYVGVNNGVLECVSDFGYYNHAGYYAKNGANIRSLNGSCAWGAYGLVSEGSDPNEVPLPVYLDDDMIQTGTVVAYNFTSAGLNTLNTAGSTVIYLRGYSYVPYNQSEVEINHGNTVDSTGNILGIQIYKVVSASTVTQASLTGIPDLIQLNLSNANLFGSTSGGLKAPVSSGTQVILRGVDVFKFKGINSAITYSGAPALSFLESTSSVYHILDYDNTGVELNDSKITLREDFNYVKLQTYNTTTNANTNTIQLLDLDSTSGSRLTAQLARTDTQMTFAWAGGIYRITNYLSSATIGQAYAQINISPNIGSTVTNAGGGSVLLKAGLRKYTPAEITRGISILRASNHDLVDIGAGSYYSSRVPSNVFGPPENPPNVANERSERGTGRIFATTNDQDGNFKVGDYFQVNQASGDLTIKASLNLTQVSGLGFKRGVVVSEFSQDTTMINNAGDVVPTQNAVVGYVANRLGLNSAGNTGGISKIGPGFLDLTGVQPMNGAIDMNLHKIANLTSATTTLEAINKGYGDTKISLAGISAIDPATGSANHAFGKMTGALELFRDPVASTDDGSTAATIRYVDQGKQLSVLSDVNLTSPDDQHFLMFTASAVSINTSSNKPVWNATKQIVNVKLDTANSNIDFARNGNTLTAHIQTSTIVNNMVSPTAAIAQSKLLMTAADNFVWPGTVAQANLGLAAFDSTYFLTTSGFVTFGDPRNFPIEATIAKRTTGTHVTSGTYLVGANFNGSWQGNEQNTWWSINGTSTNAVNTLVARDGGGNFIAGLITGTVTQSQSLQVDGGSYRTATTSTTANTIIARDSNGSIWGKEFIGTATSAYYADLAENYQADAAYEPGTVVVFGGDKEVTVSTYEQDTRIAGVVSTNPAYLMNHGLSGPAVVPVAFTGRVPTKVLGPCKKGDLMVSSIHEGVATSIGNITSNLALPGSVIGKALESIDSERIDVIEVVVGRL